MVESSTVSVPELVDAAARIAAALPEMVESSTVSVPELEMPPPSVKAEPSSMLTPETVAVTEEFTPSTLAPSPSKVTMLPGVVGCTVIEVGMVKLVSLAGSIGAGSEIYVSPLVAEDNATVNGQGEPDVQVVPVPPTAAYKVPPPVTAIETIAASPTNAPAMAATRPTRAMTSPSLPRVRSRDLVGALVACPPPCSKPSPEGTCGRP